jgi:RecA-family ATPase
VYKRYRQGAPILRLDKQTVCEPFSFVVNPFVEKRKPTVLYGHGGTGKSTLSLASACLVSTGGSLAGMSAVKGRPMYLDWEDSEEVHIRRLHALQAAHPELADSFVDYRRCTEPLARMTHELARTIQREGITYLVIDSLLAAAGGGSDAEATEQFFAALRVLDVATLIIGHVAKGPVEGQNTATIYGSVFNSNFARVTWELQVEQELGDDSSILGLFHRKTNHTRKHHPIGLKVTQNEMGTRIQYEPHDLKDTGELQQSLPLPSRIRSLLDSDGQPRTAKQISDELGVKLAVVKTTLSRNKKYKWSMLGQHDGKEALWTTVTT